MRGLRRPGYVHDQIQEGIIAEIHNHGEMLIINSSGAESMSTAGKVLIDRAHALIAAQNRKSCDCPWAEADRLAEEVQS